MDTNNVININISILDEQYYFYIYYIGGINVSVM